ncbi:HMG-box domain-containing protein SCDLUD_005201 [Saccharomycodes ludwigii]|uniref:HMG-box domain-containing protein n=1 Tax=Saccharomycodes ludwigii TaxID=36035 RepID=UPI001E86ACD2|nr:hypothetical protein SCDLUD_005201 [Saccharomycodes ludwigii]KAH3898862.1 hypothetical protein SCDLUD_005201 [Saccharomycodes ludwigii]
MNHTYYYTSNINAFNNYNNGYHNNVRLPSIGSLLQSINYDNDSNGAITNTNTNVKTHTNDNHLVYNNNANSQSVIPTPQPTIKVLNCNNNLANIITTRVVSPPSPVLLMDMKHNNTYTNSNNSNMHTLASIATQQYHHNIDDAGVVTVNAPVTDKNNISTNMTPNNSRNNSESSIVNVPPPPHIMTMMMTTQNNNNNNNNVIKTNGSDIKGKIHKCSCKHKYNTKKSGVTAATKRIPRPRNAFILFRQYYHTDLFNRKLNEQRNKNNVSIPTTRSILNISNDTTPNTIPSNNNNDDNVIDQEDSFKLNSKVSQTIGNKWRNLAPQEKQYWMDLAKQEKLQHSLRYPDYKYVPRRKTGKSGKGKNKNHEGEESDGMDNNINEFVNNSGSAGYCEVCKMFK